MKIILSENQLYNLFEAVSLNDIYNKYYSKLDNNVFRQIVETDPTWRSEKPDKMGKFGKWLLKLYINRRLKLEDLYKAKEYLSYFIKYFNRIEVKDINKYGNLVELYNVVKPFMDGQNVSTSHNDEIRNIKKGAEKAYEDNEWLVIIPHTEEASCYYGKGTQWCTASVKSENRFDEYYEQGTLYININKLNGEKYQFHFETNQFMDSSDSNIESPIDESIGLNDGILEYYKNTLNEVDFNKLIETKIEVMGNQHGEMLYYCSSPKLDYSYLYDESSGEIVADGLKRVDPSYITNKLVNNGFVLIDNLRGYYTLVSYNNEGYFEKIGGDYISVYDCDDLFGTSFKEVELKRLCMVNSEGVMEIYDPQVGVDFYNIEMSLLEDRGLIGYNIIWVKKKNGLYDFIDAFNDNRLYNLRPIDKEEPFRMDENDEYLYMIDGHDNLMEIDLENGLDYEIVDDIEDEEY